MSAESLSRQLVVFSLGQEEYALPITNVQEIIRYTEPRAVSSDAAWVRGVISLRGKIVPVYDLASRLGLDTEIGSQPKIVIVETAKDMAGVIVDAVEEVLTVTEDQLDDTMTATGSGMIEAIAKIDDRLVVLLSVAGIFAGAEVELDAVETAAAA